HGSRGFSVADQQIASGNEIASALFAQIIKRCRQCSHQRGGWCIRGLALSAVLALLAQIEVVAGIPAAFHSLPGALAHRAISQAGRNHHGLLRTTDDYVNPPAVNVEGGSAEAGDSIHNQQRACALEDARYSLCIMPCARG